MAKKIKKKIEEIKGKVNLMGVIKSLKKVAKKK